MTYRKVEIATYQKEKAGEDYCGDGYYFAEKDKGFICAITDGLGSGKMADESSQAVIDVIKNNEDISDRSLVSKCVQALAGKRGTVLGVLRVDFINQTYTYSSIGNISLVITMNEKQKTRTIPKPGFLGNYERNLKVVQGELKNEMGFLMFSDGVSDQELSKLCLFNENVDEIIQAFSHMSSEDREDDTTLIAIRYRGKQSKADS